MKYKVLKKQRNCKECIVCGLKNELGLKTSFYELENGELVGIFRTLNEHQSYPERLHGGISSAVLDETIGRAIMIKDENMWGVTIELNLKYRKPVPLNATLRAVGRVTKETSRTFEGTGEILLEDGTVAVSATGKYFKMPVDKICNFDYETEEWKLVHNDNDPKEIEI